MKIISHQSYLNAISLNLGALKLAFSTGVEGSMAQESHRSKENLH